MSLYLGESKTVSENRARENYTVPAFLVTSTLVFCVEIKTHRRQWVYSILSWNVDVWKFRENSGCYLTLRRLISYIYMKHPFLMFLDHTQRRSTVGRTPLDEWSARRRDLYLTTHDTHNRHISMPPVRFEPTISAGERPAACESLLLICIHRTQLGWIT